MCGICGYITKRKHTKFAREKFTNILLAGESRGTDACGIAFNTGNKRFYYCKAPVPAREFINENIYKELMRDFNPTAIIGHTRAKTQGDQANNYNNHPIVTKTGLSLIHNGMIHNDKDLAKEFNLTMDGEVDSEIIVRMIEYYIFVKGMTTQKAVQEMAGKVRGSMAIALLNAKEPRNVYLVASTSPLNLAYHIPTGTVFFASTKSILEEGLSEYDIYFKGLFKKPRELNDYIFETMKDDTGLRITPQGWSSFTVTRPTYTSNYSATNYDSGANRDYHFVGSRDTVDDDGLSPIGKTLYKRTKSGIFTPSQKPIIVEAKGDEAIKRALESYKGFDVAEVIKKPKNYMSELLLYRLEYIQELLFTGDYELLEDDLGLATMHLDSEVRRIINALDQRQKKTRRPVNVPTYEDIWSLKDGQSEGLQYKDIAPKWVLISKNPLLSDIMKDVKAFDDLTYFDSMEDDEVDEEGLTEEERLDREEAMEEAKREMQDLANNNALQVRLIDE